MNYNDWDKKLKKYLSNFELNETKWEQVKKELKIGEMVSGMVICRAPFGAWIDIKMEFPALLEIIFIKDLTPSNYESGYWMKEGEVIEAYVTGFRNDSRQIYLSQKKMN